MTRGIHTSNNPVCKYCGEVRKNDNSRMNHERFCSKNPNKETTPTKGKVGTFTGKKHSATTKSKISEARIKFLNENPDQVPYKLNHYSKGRSYAEEYWKVILDSNDMKYTEQYQIGPYQLDFAFLESKVDLEIDGDQHYLDKRVIESDKRRNKYLEDLGWTIIRVKWSDFKKLTNKKEYVESIINQIMRP